MLIISVYIYCLTQSIQNVYPKLFNGLHYSIDVYRNYFKPVHGYTIKRFPKNTKRNHYYKKRSNIEFIVLHYTDADFRNTVLIFTTANPAGVSSHYVIARPTEAEQNKQVLQVVPENFVANHAGKSMWGKTHYINTKSIGIEIVNYGYNKDNGTWQPFYQSQIDIVGSMVSRMVKQYKIQANNVIGHSDIAPNRKIDPGVMFPWRQLYKVYGVGAWLDDHEMNETFITRMYKPKIPCPRVVNQKVFVQYLKAYGYNTSSWKQATMAFKAHFTANQKPLLYTSKITKNDMYWIWALVAKYITH
ncbi:Hypothetical protein CINCED_3A010942 [Cinara cedri]|uniref:N-acetylmuramoyl-L-alanine amidase n=1 Tax=Cinara cedri TaxID=506608 RepID=A0A5E4MTR9_9HEMI|nr:Hypothetical protein CINCED_3A010942 [Cinara cedri]